MELLTVMAIIAILLSVASVGIQRMGESQGVTSGLAVAEGVFAQAQRLARSNGTSARVVIHSELDDSVEESRRRYRRLLQVVYKKVDPVTGEPENSWTLAGQPSTLPDQVFYSPELSRTQIEGGSEIAREQHQLSRDEADTAECYYYEFNSQGLCTTPGASFIVESGPRPRGSERPILGKTRNIGGFILWRSGGTSRIADLARIEEMSTVQ